ncbi:protein ROOT HAIR DEFECTIVE 3 homolog 1-like [Eucalyptus grandis]|uniref:protein ROOT HAIR DEFECTIVE 3 homolog 1-like n=1 Tax=Eucalyptus grandis TaxID=71139 RepID=UPI00192E8161|nr:protein ROOT HAIR DEFECTIVE 3 homolog 1-like [Eucalyptus grandis]
MIKLRLFLKAIMRLFCPRKTTLVFVLRDKTRRTPLECLEAALREEVREIWDSIPKSEQHKGTPVSHFFNVEVVALSDYEEEEERFKDEVDVLRGWFLDSTAPGGLAGDRRGAVPSSGFCFIAQRIWMVIKENKDLDLPAHRVMVAHIRCEEIADEHYSSLTENEDWLSMKEVAQFGAIPDFGKKLSSILDTCLSGYKSQTTHFDGNVRSKRWKQLEKWSLRVKKLWGWFSLLKVLHFFGFYCMTTTSSCLECANIFLF